MPFDGRDFEEKHLIRATPRLSPLAMLAVIREKARKDREAEEYARDMMYKLGC